MPPGFSFSSRSGGSPGLPLHLPPWIHREPLHRSSCGVRTLPLTIIGPLTENDVHKFFIATDTYAFRVPFSYKRVLKWDTCPSPAGSAKCLLSETSWVPRAWNLNNASLRAQRPLSTSSQ